jgi:hypothetical protein
MPTVLDESWLWLAGSLLVAILWVNLTPLFQNPRPGTFGNIASRVTTWRFSPWLLQFLRPLYYVGVPFAALAWRGALSELYLGVSDGLSSSLRGWAYGVGWAAALGVGAWGLLALGWWAYRRAVVATGEGATSVEIDAPPWALLIDAIYFEAHWAFYRCVPIVALGEDAYRGTWLGLGLVAVEAVLDPEWRRGFVDPEKAPRQLMRAALAVVSSVFFVVTGDGNLWLAIAVHWGVSWGLAALARALPVPPVLSAEPGQPHRS